MTFELSICDKLPFYMTKTVSHLTNEVVYLAVGEYMFHDEKNRILLTTLCLVPNVRDFCGFCGYHEEGLIRTNLQIIYDTLIIINIVYEFLRHW